MTDAIPTHREALARLAERKALAEAELAAITAEHSMTAARLAVPAAGIDGTVKLDEKAGAMETALLTGHAVKRAARLVANEVLKGLPALAETTTGASLVTVMVVPAGELPRFDALTDLFTRRDLLQQALVQGNDAGDDAIAELASAQDRITKQANSENRGAELSVTLAPAATGAVAEVGRGTVAGVGLALQAATALLGFFKSDFDMTGRVVATDDAFLTRAVAGALRAPTCGAAPTVEVPLTLDMSRVHALSERLRTFTESIASQRRKAAANRETLKQELERITSAESAIKDDTANAAAQRSELTARRAVVQRGHDALQTLLDAADAFLAAPFPAGESGGALLREWNLWERLQQPETHLLVLKMEQAGGSSFTIKNLWTAFGRMPYHVSAGVVVSYQLFVGTTGALELGGIVPVHGGFITPRELAWREP